MVYRNAVETEAPEEKISDEELEKKYKTYPAENVIANNGKSNTIALIKDPLLFCNATFFFAENLFADVFSAADNDE